MRWKSNRTASDADSPIASSAAIAFAFTSLSMRTCSIELCAPILTSVSQMRDMALGGSAVKPPSSPRLRERPGAAEVCPILTDHIRRPAAATLRRSRFLATGLNQ